MLEVRVVNPIFSLSSAIQKVIAYFSRGVWLFDPRAINNRSHDKILLVDAGTANSVAVLGGRNLGDDDHGLNGIEKEIVDYEILVRGGGLRYA